MVSTDTFASESDEEPEKHQAGGLDSDHQAFNDDEQIIAERQSQDRPPAGDG